VIGGFYNCAAIAKGHGNWWMIWRNFNGAVLRWTGYNCWDSVGWHLVVAYIVVPNTIDATSDG
jgi:hypothetical protein